MLFPQSVVPLEVGRQKSIAALEDAMMHDQRIMLAAQKDADKNEPKVSEIYRFGVVAKVNQFFRMPQGQIKVLVEALQRARIDHFTQTDPYYRVEIALLDEGSVDESEASAWLRTARKHFEEYVKRAKKSIGNIDSLFDQSQTPGRIADLLVSQLDISIAKKQELFELLDPIQRLEAVCVTLAKEIEMLDLERKVQMQVRKQMERSQREYYLREQMKAIQKELGERDERAQEIEDYRQKIEKASMPKEAKEKALHELGRLEKMPPVAAEAVVVRNYLDWLTSLPWSKKSRERRDLAKAEAILDADHFGLEKVKERILEFLAVRQLADRLKGPILCLVGPPGVGKTSLAASVARALNREFVRFSLGGVRDEAEIRGHRRTYVGAMPGRVIQAMRQAKVKNPLILLDEVDKLGSDFRGDPASSLLEVLDPEQNHAFTDHYLETPFDLSDVFFMTTANLLDTIPRPLLDRMEVIRLDGYTVEEKEEIARRHLIPKQRRDHGLKEDQFTISNNALRQVITGYTKESGVRSLERQIGSLCRKGAREVIEGKSRVGINLRNLEHYLGRPIYRASRSEEESKVGVAHGLAYTQVGGDLMVVETAVVEGKGNLILTGKLGEVMRESAQAAFSYLRSRAETLGLPSDFYEQVDAHIHVPEGAVPKEGPSAGITIATALASALTGHPVRADVAMTGEITLRGRVLPVGGIKEKVLAAHRGGIRLVLLPAENEKDLEEIPSNIRRTLDIELVEHMDEVLEHALEPLSIDSDTDVESEIPDHLTASEEAAVTQETWLDQ